MNRDVTPISKESQAFPGVRVACPCGCGITSVMLRKATKAGDYHVRGCKCPSHMGGRNRRKGQRAQSEYRKAAGVPDAKWAGRNGNEETWADNEFAHEHKADGVNARPAVGAFLRIEGQAKTAKAIGDPRPVIAGVTYYGVQVSMMRAEVLKGLRDELGRLRAIVASIGDGAA